MEQSVERSAGHSTVSATISAVDRHANRCSSSSSGSIVGCSASVTGGAIRVFVSGFLQTPASGQALTCRTAEQGQAVQNESALPLPTSCPRHGQAVGVLASLQALQAYRPVAARSSTPTRCGVARASCEQQWRNCRMRLLLPLCCLSLMPSALRRRSVLLPAFAAVAERVAHHPCVHASLSPPATNPAGLCCILLLSAPHKLT